MAGVLESLGLELNVEPRTLWLANGVELVYRPPEGTDWQVARKRAEEAFSARDALATAVLRYGWTSADAVKLLDPDRWSEAAIFCTAVELAPLVVTEVARVVAGERKTLPPTLEVFRVLFKQNRNLEAFWAAAKEADAELIQPKKEPPPSLNTFGAGAASTVAAAPAPGPAKSRRSAPRAAPKS